MIAKSAKYFCSEDISLIENYEEAVNDPNTWHCHHRLELDDEGHRLNTRNELKEKGLYFNRPASELIFLKASDHMKLHMSEEQKERLKDVQNKLWKQHGRKRKVRERFAKKRDNGEFLTNIEQMASDDDYREYQKVYKHIWYDQNREKWNRYNYMRKLAKLTDEELELLKKKHENNIKVNEFFGKTERAEKLKTYVNIINEAQLERFATKPAEQEIIETVLKNEDMVRYFEEDTHNG